METSLACYAVHFTVLRNVSTDRPRVCGVTIFRPPFGVVHAAIDLQIVYVILCFASDSLVLMLRRMEAGIQSGSEEWNCVKHAKFGHPSIPGYKGRSYTLQKPWQARASTQSFRQADFKTLIALARLGVLSSFVPEMSLLSSLPQWVRLGGRH